jgi:endonuclease/exonuclease/phosphatase family protein
MAFGRQPGKEFLLFETVSSGPRRRGGRLGLCVMVALMALALTAPATSQATTHKPPSAKPARVKVMSRNLYLGADLSPGTSASSLQELANAAGQILNQVDENRFGVRAKGLAQEILNRKADLVGLQEVALWRQAPCSDNPLEFTAREVRRGGNFLALLMHHLNQGERRYRLVISEPEFDFQVWANTDGDESTGTPFGCEIEGRLTMRDAILARRDTVETSNARRGHFETLLQVTPGGVPIDVTRGWTRVNARVKGGPKLSRTPTFRFVNTHLEAFDNQASNHTNQDTDVGNGEVREAQSKELIANGGPAAAPRPVILVGDLNSDTKTPIKPGDQLAHRALLNAGFRERSTYDPLGCCLDADVLAVGSGGDISQFDHKVDHVMADGPNHVKLVSSLVTGRHPRNGFWDSDHAGMFSALDFK